MTRLRHGHAARKIRGTPSPEYRIWCGMIRRCSSPLPKFRHWHNVKVCERWRVFENFLADMGQRPSPTHSIDRYPNRAGNYEPGNVRWATRTEQNRNTSRNRLIEHAGTKLSVAEWAERLGINANTIRVRLHRGQSIARALAPTRSAP